MSEDKQLIKIDEDVNKETAVSLQTAFTPYFQKAKEIEKKAKALVVTSEDQLELMEEARQMRLALKAVRVDTEKIRKDMKGESLRKGKAIDGVANVIKFLVVPIEEHLQKQEDFVKTIEAEKVRKIHEDRVSKIESLEADPAMYNLTAMNNEAFAALVVTLERQKQERIDIANKEEEDRIIKEKADAIEQERIRKENIKLKEEAKIRDAKELEEKKKREEVEAALKVKVDAERKEKERIEKELQDKKEADEKERLRLEKEKKDSEIDNQKALEAEQLAPDKDKLKKLAHQISAIEMPEMSEDKTKEILIEVVNRLNDVVGFIKEQTI